MAMSATARKDSTVDGDGRPRCMDSFEHCRRAGRVTRKLAIEKLEDLPSQLDYLHRHGSSMFTDEMIQRWMWDRRDEIAKLDLKLDSKMRPEAKAIWIQLQLREHPDFEREYVDAKRREVRGYFGAAAKTTTVEKAQAHFFGRFIERGFAKRSVCFAIPYIGPHSEVRVEYGAPQPLFGFASWEALDREIQAARETAATLEAAAARLARKDSVLHDIAQFCKAAPGKAVAFARGLPQNVVAKLTSMGNSPQLSPEASKHASKQASRQASNQASKENTPSPSKRSSTRSTETKSH